VTSDSESSGLQRSLTPPPPPPPLRALRYRCRADRVKTMRGTRVAMITSNTTRVIADLALVDKPPSFGSTVSADALDSDMSSCCDVV